MNGHSYKDNIRNSRLYGVEDDTCNSELMNLFNFILEKSERKSCCLIMKKKK